MILRQNLIIQQCQTYIIHYLLICKMNLDEKKNRSVLLMAGQRSLGENLSFINANKAQPRKLQSKEIELNKHDITTKKLMMKLTLPRLRKMQALVRGFIVRRTIYPQRLQQYLLAKSILNLVISNVIYRESSQIILENITFIKYDKNPLPSIQGFEKVIENMIFQGIFQKVMRKQIENIVELTVTSSAKLLTRPKITYGFNLRDPLELLLFDTINNFVGTNYKQIVREAIQECVKENREIRLIDSWIQQYQMLKQLYEQIVNEALNESIGQYIVQNMLERIRSEGAEVVARVCMDEELERKKEEAYKQIELKMVEWMLQEGSLKSIISLGYSIQK